VQRPFTSVAEGCVAEIVAERDGFGEIFIEPESACNRASDLAHFEGVRQAVAEMPALVVQKNLRLVLKSAESGRVDNAVAVTLELGPRWARPGAIKTPKGIFGLARIGRCFVHLIVPGLCNGASCAYLRASVMTLRPYGHFK